MQQKESNKGNTQNATEAAEYKTKIECFFKKIDDFEAKNGNFDAILVFS